MARTRTRPPVVVTSRRNDVYVGMLGLTCLAMLVGVVLLALELNDYEWKTEATKGPSLTAPVDTPRKAADPAAAPAAEPKT